MAVSAGSIQGWAKKETPGLVNLAPFLLQLAWEILAAWGPLFGPALYNKILPNADEGGRVKNLKHSADVVFGWFLQAAPPPSVPS